MSFHVCGYATSLPPKGVAAPLWAALREII